VTLDEVVEVVGVPIKGPPPYGYEIPQFVEVVVVLELLEDCFGGRALPFHHAFKESNGGHDMAEIFEIFGCGLAPTIVQYIVYVFAIGGVHSEVVEVVLGVVIFVPSLKGWSWVSVWVVARVPRVRRGEVIERVRNSRG